MKQQILFVHSAGPQSDNKGSHGIICHLEKTLGDRYDIITPSNSDNDYTHWKYQLDKAFEKLNDNVIIIGHSLGASLLLKYLSEQNITQKIHSFHAIAAPYWSFDEDWQNDSYELIQNYQKKLPEIGYKCFYHGTNDKVVPIIHVKRYLEDMPYSKVVIVQEQDHYFLNGLPELTNKINKFNKGEPAL